MSNDWGYRRVPVSFNQFRILEAANWLLETALLLLSISSELLFISFGFLQILLSYSSMGVNTNGAGL
jgi:hypothetical protein